MLTKYYVEIDGIKHELSKNCIKNWEEVKCAYKRSDYSGVTRSFTSQFEFVDEAYDMLMKLYLRDGFKAKAIIYLYTITDRWEWVEQFSAPIDFSTILWDRYVLKVNCIDNSLAALIKSRKSTKYEFVIGEEIFPHKTLFYDRMKMMNTVTHYIVGDGTTESGWTTLNEATSYRRLATYLTKEELFAGSPITCQDQTPDSGSSMISVVNALEELTITTDILFDGAYNVEVHLFEFDAASPDFDGTYKDLGIVFKYSWQEARARRFLGIFADLAALKKAYPTPPEDSWAGVGTPIISMPGLSPEYEKPYFAPVTDNVSDREWTEGTNSFHFGSDWGLVFDCNTQKFVKHFTLKNLVSGKRYALFYKTYISDNVIDKTTTALIKSKITSQWLGRGSAIDIDALRPKDIAAALLNKISDSQLNVKVNISDYDARLAKTYLVAAESIRGIKPSKIYTSFNDLCNWFETVFGYTYYLGEESEGEQDIFFVHRSEIFDSASPRLLINNAVDTQYSVVSSNLYSIVEIGYEKKDYETECGRDEWNFTQYYNTGIDIIEKKLVLQSKYRADCYGFEFLAQKRNQDTTDNQSDSDIFFVYCDEVADVMDNNDPTTSRGDSSDSVSGVSTHLVINRSCKIDGALTDTVFNGEFSPYFCIKANEGYIASMAERLTLQFASSDGNSNITINGHSVTDNIILSNRLFTPGTLSFSTDYIDEPANVSGLIEVESNGIVYRGFINEVTLKYAHTEAAKYKLIIKDIEL